MTAYPKIYSENYVNKIGVNTLSSGASVIARAYDWDQRSYWSSVGSDDSTVETWVHEFYRQAASVARTFDTVILLGHNLKKWKLQYWNGSAWADTAASYTEDSGSTTITTISEVSNCTKVRLYMETVQSGTQKQVGELIVCKLLYTFPQYIDTDFDEDNEDAAIDQSSQFGNRSRILLRPTLYRYQKATLKFSIPYQSDSDVDAQALIKQNYSPFIFHPFPDINPDYVFQVLWTSKIRKRLSGKFYTGTNSWTLDYVFKEA